MKKLITALLLCTSTLTCANEEPAPQPYVTCKLTIGQLGNQLFQIAASLAYAWDYNAIPVFPELNATEARLSYNRDRIFFRLDASESPRPFINTYYEPLWYSSDRIPYQPDQMLWGYFHSWKHFDHHRDKILATYAPSDAIKTYLEEKYDYLLECENTVGVHVRTYNIWDPNSKQFPFLGLNYYKQAMDHFPPDTIFVIFSDRIKWCKKHFPELNRQFIFIEDNDGIQDLYLMSMMKHNIIANSTFSWWSAYLNQNQNRMVVAPQYWMHPDFHAFPPPQPNDFYFPEWVVIPTDFSEPYPSDMAHYDEKSQSVDGD